MFANIVVSFALLCGLTSAFSPIAKTTSVSSQQSTRLSETFGTGLGSDFNEIKKMSIGNEASYKQWVNNVKEDNMLNRKVCDAIEWQLATIQILENQSQFHEFSDYLQ
jgi:hypothetical protein